MEHAGLSGRQIFVGVKMEAYGDQAAASSNHVAASLGRGLAAITNIEN